MMSEANIGWLFYKDYLRIDHDPVSVFSRTKDLPKEIRDDFFSRHFENKNKAILNQEFNPRTGQLLNVVTPDVELKLTVSYPGLTIGTGYTHETGELGEFKLGFYFDHTSGYPCIPGSSVKGCLRSAFPQNKKDGIADKKQKYNYLACIIRNLPDIDPKLVLNHELGEEYDTNLQGKRKAFIDFLEREIFDGEYPERDNSGELVKKDSEVVYSTLGIYERDVFHDAYITDAQHPAINRDVFSNRRPFIWNDFITPHLNRNHPELSPFTNPNPLMFLKILPSVSIQFQLELKDGLLTAKQKKQLFRSLLLDFGIGAKTNVGYGQFKEGFNSPVMQEGPGSSSTFSSSVANYRAEPVDFTGALKTNLSIEAKVTDSQNKKGYCILKGKRIEVAIAAGNCPDEGTIVVVKIGNLNNKKEFSGPVTYIGPVKKEDLIIR